MDNFDIKEITKKIYNDLYIDCITKNWFDYLDHDAIFSCSGEPVLIGKSSIISHISEMNHRKSSIISEEYNEISFKDEGSQVFGSITVCNSEVSDYQATTHFACTWKFINNEPKIVLQHMYYDYHQVDDTSLEIPMDINTRKFVRSLLLSGSGKRITIKSGTTTLSIDINSIIYADCYEGKTRLVCIDKIISCNYTYPVLKSLLDKFYEVRRGTIINTSYITSIERFNIELIDSIKINIPEKKYTKVKKDLFIFYSKK